MQSSKNSNKNAPRIDQLIEMAEKLKEQQQQFASENGQIDLLQAQLAAQQTSLYSLVVSLENFSSFVDSKKNWVRQLDSANSLFSRDSNDRIGKPG